MKKIMTHANVTPITATSAASRIRANLNLIKRERNRLICVLYEFHMAPKRPPVTPNSINIGNSKYSNVRGCSNFPKLNRPVKVKLFKPWYADRTIFSVNELIMDATRVRQIRFWFQKLAASSNENNIPPIGEPKAAATPAAAPPNTKSRFSWSSRKARKTRKSLTNVVLFPWDIPAATTAPAWAIGPSCSL